MNCFPRLIPPLLTLMALLVASPPAVAEDAFARQSKAATQRIVIDGRAVDVVGRSDLRLPGRAPLRVGRGVVPDTIGRPVVAPQPVELPLLFEQNLGQGPREALFVQRGLDHAAAIMPDGIALGVFRKAPGGDRAAAPAAGRRADGPIRPTVLRGGRAVAAD
ncbi:MAG: hypothetical protein AAFV96_14465, partial [Pseudomonadota bacterium]